jgi:hypothetical protein
MPELPRAELADHRPSPPVRQAIRLVLGAPAQVMAALLAITLGVSIHLARKHDTFAGHATARVLEHHVAGIHAYHVQVAYRDAAGADHTGWINLRDQLRDTYPVDYDPDHPDRVIWHQPSYTNPVLIVVLLVFGSGAVGGLMIAMWAGAQKLRRRDSIRGGPVLPLLVLPAICIALAVWLVRILAA